VTTVTYSSNNSGGGWWLKDEDWHALEKAGWTVDWVKNETEGITAGGERWLGALATSATKEEVTLAEAIESFEFTTGQSSTELGCGCCGPPHSFYTEDGDEYYSPSAPTHGDPYVD